MRDHAEVINHVLVALFNEILRIEERALAGGVYSKLSLREIHVIEAVCAAQEAQGANTMSALAARLSVTQGSLTVAAATLARKGYVTRTRAEHDRRIVHLLPTRKALEVNARHQRFHAQMTAGVMAHLPPDELDVLVRALRGVTAYFESKKEAPRMLHIITDSMSDIFPAEAANLQVNVVALSVFMEGAEYRDQIDITCEAFYARMRGMKELPKTSQATPEAFAALFERLYEPGDDIVVLTGSSHLSGTYQSALQAKSEFAHAQHVYVYDTLNASLGEAMYVMEAARLRNAGRGAQAVTDALEALRPRVRVFGYVDDLRNLRMGGRLSSASAVVGKVLHIKPLLFLQNGKIDAVGTARGVKQAQAWLLKQLASFSPDLSYPVIIASANTPDVRRDVLAMVREALGPEAVLQEMAIGTVIGTHTGEGILAICCVEQAAQ